jgi:hypothetical protein
MLVPVKVVTLGTPKYDLLQYCTFADTGEWSVPPQRGFPVSGLMGHASAFDPEAGLIYVDGGITKSGDGYMVTTHLFEYDPVSHIWRNLTSR